MADKTVPFTAEQVIDLLHLEPLPYEGGHFRGTYHADEQIPLSALPPRYSSPHRFGGAIFYLLSDAPDSFSALHLLPTDEIYHFYLGDPVEMLLLYAKGEIDRIVLGSDIFNGQHVQYTVPRGVWMGSHLLPGGRWALMGTTMAPSYEEGDRVIGKREMLILRYPAEAELIRRLTRINAGNVGA